MKYRDKHLFYNVCLASQNSNRFIHIVIYCCHYWETRTFWQDNFRLLKVVPSQDFRQYDILSSDTTEINEKYL